MPQSFQQLAIRCATCLMLFSEPVVPSASGTPALRKYFCASISVATWLHDAGTSTSFISKTASPEGLRITDERFSYLNKSKTLVPSLVKCRLNFSPDFAAGGVFLSRSSPISQLICGKTDRCKSPFLKRRRNQIYYSYQFLSIWSFPHSVGKWV